MLAPDYSEIDPASGCLSPAMVASSVDLPAPFGPIKPTRSPVLMTKEILSRRVRPGSRTERLLTDNMKNASRNATRHARTTAMAAIDRSGAPGHVSETGVLLRQP